MSNNGIPSELNHRIRAAWSWVPSLYFAEGIPLVIISAVSVIMYKNMGVSNEKIAFYTGWLYLPWVIKPLWGPLVDIFRTKRLWIILTQVLMGAGFACVALCMPLPSYFIATICVFWLMAFNSATHDIAADGFYMLSLDEHGQAWFVGIRSTFYRLAVLSGQGLLVMLAGYIQTHGGSMAFSWCVSFFTLAALFFLIAIYHFFILPRPSSDVPKHVPHSGAFAFLKDFFKIFLSFFTKKGIGPALAFLLFFRMGEAQLVKLAAPFLMDAQGKGGLALSTGQIGLVYGTVGMIMLTLGGICGGFFAAKDGLKKWLWPMALAINVPDIVYVYMAWALPDNFMIINLCVAFEQFGYGFGFTAYMLFMVYFAEGEYKTSHFAIMTGLMALGMMLPGMISGYIQSYMGYPLFFVWVLVSTVPGFIVLPFLKIDSEFGRKRTKQKGV
ncbi:MAG: MFS transporter [Lentisphaerae bacterium GWF2_44_16]|nr:MAG: MFS transporter [Lentisphaerae bacterium GWF2_44_16]